MNLGISHQGLAWQALSFDDSEDRLWPNKACLILFSPDRIDQNSRYNDQPIASLIQTRFQAFLLQQLETGEKLLFNPEQEEWMLILLRPFTESRALAEKLRWELNGSDLLSIQSQALSCSFALGFYDKSAQVQQAVEEVQALLLQAKLRGPDSLLCSLRKPAQRCQ